MKINTAHFGEVEIDENSIIHFEEGIPGFENVKKFVLLQDESNNAFKWLQSVEHATPAFAMLSPFEIKNDYEVELDSATKESLAISDVNEVAVCSIANIPSKITSASVNLKAPIIINTKNNKGRQMIMHNSSYDIRHSIIEEMVGTAFTAVATSAITTEEK